MAIRIIDSVRSWFTRPAVAISMQQHEMVDALMKTGHSEHVASAIAAQGLRYRLTAAQLAFEKGLIDEHSLLLEQRRARGLFNSPE